MRCTHRQTLTRLCFPKFLCHYGAYSVIVPPNVFTYVCVRRNVCWGAFNKVLWNSLQISPRYRDDGGVKKKTKKTTNYYSNPVGRTKVTASRARTKKCDKMQAKLQLWWWNLSGSALIIITQRGSAAEAERRIKPEREEKQGERWMRPYEEEWLCPWVNIGFADIVFMNEATDKHGGWDSRFNLVTSLSKAILRVWDEKKNQQIAQCINNKTWMPRDSVHQWPFLVASRRICFQPLRN